MDGILVFIIVLAVLGALAVFALKVLFVGFLIKKGIDVYVAHQQAFDQAIREQQALLQNLPRDRRTLTPQVARQFQAAFWKAQSEMRQLDDLRRQQSELRLSEMTSQAAEAGIFISPSSF